jgi:hypothetical protein
MTGVTLSTTLDMAIENVKFQKEQRVAVAAEAGDGHDADAGTALTAIGVYRGAEPVSLIEMPPNRDKQLAVARVAASVFSADILSVAFETWETHLKRNPITNRRWRPGEQQHVALHHDGRKKGWIRDMLMACVVNRAGDIVQTGLPYRVEGATVHWDEKRAKRMRESAGHYFTGYVPDALLAIMNEPTMDVVLYRLYAAQLGLNLPIEGDRLRDHMDCVGVKMVARLASKLGTPVGVTLTADRGSERQKIIDRSLQREDGLTAQWFNGDGEPPAAEQGGESS